MRVTAIVPAAGAGSRITKKKGQRKPFFVVSSRPILIHTLLALEGSRCIDDIIVVVHRDDIKRCRTLFKKFKLKKIKIVVSGGKTRFESVKKGLSFVSGASDIVLIHDGVRPFVDKRVIKDSVRACKRFGAAVVGVGVVSTVKALDKRSRIKATVDRKALCIAQTPQVFKRSIILRAYNKASKDGSGITDDSMLVERLGYKVKVVPGSYENIKVTTPGDLMLVEAILRKRKT